MLQPRLQILDIPLFQTFFSSSSERRLQVHPHWHKEIEVLYVQEGSARQQGGNLFFDIRDNDIVIIGKNQLHSTYSHEGINYCCMVFVFDMEKFLPPEISHSERFLLNDFSNGVRFFPFTDTCKKIMKDISDCLVTIKNAYESKNYTYEWIIRQKIFEFMSLVLRNGKQLIEEQNNKSDSVDILNILKKTFKLIEENYFEDIDLAKAAKASSLSVTHFCRLFRYTTGMTFKEYLNLYRINRAEEMLLSRKSETVVASECGFGSFDSFLRNFKKHKNCTPSVFKKQNGIW